MTHTTKHTPGPWEVVGSRICTVANDKERITLAKTEPGGAFAMSEQQEANATLLAAAPAMYALLKRAAISLQEYCAEINGDMNDSLACEIEATIAQAEGVSHE